MKKSLLIAGIILTTGFVSAQEKSADEQGEEPVKKRIETIKIIDGDTVMHDIRIIEGNGDHERDERREMHYRWMTDGGDEDLDLFLDNHEIYIQMNDAHKKMFIYKMERNGEDFETIMEELEIDEDVVIDIDRGNHQMKVIKIKINRENGEEITTIEIDGHGKKNVSTERRRYGNKELRAGHGLMIFPNPTKDEITIEFEVMEGSDAELTVTGTNGEKIFSQTFDKAGSYKEKIKLKKAIKGIYIVNLNQKGRSISKKIILE